MPATEQTWRDQKLLHLVFAVSCVAMLLATIWMFAADHMREWKQHQRAFRAVEIKFNGWRQDAELERQMRDHPRLEAVWQVARSEMIDRDLLAQFLSEAKAGGGDEFSSARLDGHVAQLEIQAAGAVQERAIAKRAQVIADLRTIITSARFREDTLLRNRKFTNANLDSKKGELGIAVRDSLAGHSDPKLTKLQQDLQREIDALKVDVAALTGEYQDANSHRKELQRIVAMITAKEDAIRAALDENEDALADLQDAYRQRRSTYFQWGYPLLGKKWLEMPILDAFGSPLKIKTVWDDDNRINYNFSYVRRFDHCTTCHQAAHIAKAGTATEPDFPHESLVGLLLPTPDASNLPKPRLDDEGNALPLSLGDLYGIEVQDGGPLNYDDVAIAFVLDGALGAQANVDAGAESRAEVQGAQIVADIAHATDTSAIEERPGLMMGDLFAEIDGNLITSAAQARRLLFDRSRWGEPIPVRVRRGLPHPYATHPRLDLFVGDLSPHPMQSSKRAFGCTSCHEGQASGTEFKWVSHTPNDPDQRKEWMRQYGWFDNHHWIYPQNPERFFESGCLKCHHDITELEPSQQFPDPPAPKVVRGYNVIAKYGCFGCHEINGYDGPDKRIGPDLRAEPNFFGAALAIRAEAGFDALTTDEKARVNRLIDRPDLDRQRRQIYQMLMEDTPRLGYGSHAEILDLFGSNSNAVAAVRIKSDPGFDQLSDEQRGWVEKLIKKPDDNQLRDALVQLVESDAPRLSQRAHETVAPLLTDVATPGRLRKVGPSLRFVKHKLDLPFMYDWIRDPQRFRPWKRDPHEFRPGTRMPNVFGRTDHLEGESLATSERFEPIEILAIATYLLEYSQGRRDDGFQYLESTVDTPPSAQRGRMLFDTRGCLACHTHSAFRDADGYRPADEIAQGPDLSGIANKLVGTGTVRNPNGRRWLYSWIKQPSRYHARTLMPDLFLEPTNYPVTDAQGKSVLDADGNIQVIPIDPASDIVEFLLTESNTDWRPADDTLTGLDDETKPVLQELALLHLSEAEYEKAAIAHLTGGIPASRRGDFPGAEQELVVEPDESLNDDHKLLYVGRKSIAKYGCYGCHDIPGFEDAKPIGTTLADWGRKETSKLAFGHILNYLEGDGHNHQPEQPQPFYLESLQAGQRAGFIDQKLRAPRSYDYHDTENKNYSERLRMPDFPLSDEDREAIVTFVLGLVADPPAEKFLYLPPPRDAAIQAGKQVLQKYNCGGCHVLELEKWQISYNKGDFPEPLPVATYPFLKPHFSPDQLAASAQEDWRGKLRANLVGMGALGTDGLPLVNDDEGFPLEGRDKYALDRLEYPLVLWEPVALDGHTYEVGGVPLKVLAPMIQRRQPLRGGMLSRYLVPKVVETDRVMTSAAAGKGAEALGWVPPPLHGEGAKVRPDWLHDFLLDPYPIRPSVVLRMPRFNMSSTEASKLVAYFAAVENADYPNPLDEQLSDDLAQAEVDYQAALKTGATSPPPPEGIRFNHAMRIVTDNNYCVKCHRVADFEPTGSARAKAPDLSRLAARLRPSFMRDWIANPKLLLPYTSMPENIPYKAGEPHLGGVDQQLYRGTSIEQVDALVDLLSHFEEYAKRRSRIAPLVKPAAPAAAATGTAGGNSE